MAKMAWKILEPMTSAKNENQVNEAEILLYDEIGEYWGKSAKDFVKEIKALGDVSEITLRINSAGGDVFDANAMYNYLKTHKAHKTVRIDGLAASAASFLAMAGDTIIMPSNALMMIHNPWTFAFGESEDMRKTADFLDKVRDSIATIYMAKTGLDYEKIKSLMDEETWMDASEALSMGFCSELDDAIEIAACARSLDEGDVAWKTVAGAAYFSHNLAAKMPSAAQKVPLKLEQGAESHKKEESVLDIKNAADLEKHFPQFTKEIRDAAYADGAIDGVSTERERLKNLDALAGSGRDAILTKAKYDEPKDARDVAMELLKASADAKALNDRKADAELIDEVLLPTNGGPTAKEKEEEAEKKVADAINEMRGYRS